MEYSFPWTKEQSLKTTSGLRLEWKSGGCVRESHVFSFLDCEWCLQKSYDYPRYSVHLQKKTPWDDFQPFEVITWIVHERATSKPIHCTSSTVTSAYQRIWGISETEIKLEIPKFGEMPEYTVVCVFPDVQKKTKNQSIQASLEFKSDFEGLSIDFSNLLEKGAVSDVQLKCGESIFPAHRAVLAARSEVFAAMFRSDMTERQTGVVNMPDDPKALELLLKYVYCGKLSDIPQDLLLTLYATANKYAVLGLKKACLDCMTQCLTEENCLGYLVLADAHSDVDFKVDVVGFIENNKRILDSKTWSKFTKEHSKLANEVYHICFQKWFSNK